MTKVFLKKDTVVNGNVTSETLTVGDQLIVDGSDIIIKVPIQGEIKTFNMSKVIEAIMALNERTCMMYPDHNFIKAESADPTHDKDDDGLPDLMSGLTFEITDVDGGPYSVVLSETSITTSLRRGNILTSGEIDVLVDAFNRSDIRPNEHMFISPVIYENGETNKVGLRSFQLEDYSTAILPATDGLYKYIVSDYPESLEIKIEGKPESYENTFVDVFTTGMFDDMTPLLYPIPPLLDGIIYDNEEFKRLSDVIKNSGKESNGFGLCKLFDIERKGVWELVSGAIIDIKHWPVDDIKLIDGYIVRAPESIISAVVCDDMLCSLGSYQYEILERPVYTVCINNGGEPITIAEDIELDTEYGFDSGDILSQENMNRIKVAAENAFSERSINILIGNIVQEYTHKNNTLTLVAAINNTTQRATEDASSEITFTDTRTNDKGTLYTYTFNGTAITVKRTSAQTMEDYIPVRIVDNSVQLISPITNAIIINGNAVDETSPSFILDGLFSGLSFKDMAKITVDISHWKLETVSSAVDMFMGCTDSDGNDIKVTYDTNFSDIFISNFANKLCIRLIPPEGEPRMLEAISTNAYSFSLNQSLTSSDIDVCKSVVTGWLAAAEYYNRNIFSYTETVPYLISDDKAYIRSFFDADLTSASIDTYTYNMTTTATNRLDVIAMSVKATEGADVSIPPLMEPVYMYLNETGFVDGKLAIDYSKLAAGSKLNGEVDISHWSLCGVTSLNDAFSDCVSMTSLKCEHKDTDSLNGSCDMSALCSGCASLEKIELTSLPFNIRSVDNMFAGCEYLSEVIISDVTLDVNSLDGLFNGCSSPEGVDVQIYINNINKNSPVDSFTDTFTNVLSMTIKTTGDDESPLFKGAVSNNLRWYYDDGREYHGFTSCIYVKMSNVFEVRPCVTVSRDTSTVSSIPTDREPQYASTSIGPDVNYTGMDVPTIKTIELVDNDSIIASIDDCSLEYVTDILNCSVSYMELLSELVKNDLISDMLIETLPDNYLMVVKNSNTIKLRQSAVGSEYPYSIQSGGEDGTVDISIDYTKLGDLPITNPPLRRPVYVNSVCKIVNVNIVGSSLQETNIIASDDNGEHRPIVNGIADYTHWDTERYLTSDVVEQLFSSDGNDNTLVNTIVAPHVNSSIMSAINYRINVTGNGAKLNLYTYTNINGDVPEDQYTYPLITKRPLKINGMQGYLIKPNQASQ